MAYIRVKDEKVVEIAATPQPDNRDGGEWNFEDGTVDDLLEKYKDDFQYS